MRRIFRNAMTTPLSNLAGFSKSPSSTATSPESKRSTFPELRRSMTMVWTRCASQGTSMVRTWMTSSEVRPFITSKRTCVTPTGTSRRQSLNVLSP